MFRLNRPGAAFRKGECEHARPQLFADQPRATGKVDPELLLSPQCREFTLTTGLSPLEFPTQQSYIGTRCHLCRAAPDCSASILTLTKSFFLNLYPAARNREKCS